MRSVADAVAELKDVANVANWLASRVETRRGGKNLLVKCPFCQSDTFDHGRAQATHYRCYRASCPTGGESLDIIEVAALFNHGQPARGEVFMETLLDLCSEFGVAPPSSGPNGKKGELPSEPQERQLSLYRDAVRFWRYRLDDDTKEAAKAREYLAVRGVTEEQIKRHQVGYAPRGARLKAFLLKRGYSESEIGKAQLVNTSGFDFFQERVVFPVNLQTETGTIYGRDISGREEVTRHLYLRERPTGGLWGLTSADTAFLSEGIFDALAQERAIEEVGVPKQYGRAVSLATYGTQGFRAEYIQHLKEAGIKRVVVVADGDTPGLVAAKRTGELLLPEFTVVFVLLPVGQDPNSVIVERGSKQWLEYVRNAVSLVDIEVLLAMRDFDLSTTTEKILAIQAVSRILKKENQAIKWLTIKRLAAMLGIPLEVMRKTKF